MNNEFRLDSLIELVIKNVSKYKIIQKIIEFKSARPVLFLAIVFIILLITVFFIPSHKIEYAIKNKWYWLMALPMVLPIPFLPVFLLVILWFINIRIM